MIRKRAATTSLERIYDALWDVDIPSPTVPEYVEHHEEIQMLMKMVRREQKKINALPSMADMIIERIRKEQEESGNDLTVEDVIGIIREVDDDG